MFDKKFCKNNFFYISRTKYLKLEHFIYNTHPYIKTILRPPKIEITEQIIAIFFQVVLK